MNFHIGLLLLASALTSYAQIIPRASTYNVVGGFEFGSTTTYTGYNPSESQGVVFGSHTAGGEGEDMLLMADASSKGFVVVHNGYIDSAEAFYYRVSKVDTSYLGGMAVLRPMQGMEQSALVAMRGSQRLFVYEIKVDDIGIFTATKLATQILPTSQHFASKSDADKSRLALISTSTSGSNIQYHLATSNPTTNSNMGRVDFITIDASTWTLIQPYKDGLTGGVPSNMPILGDNARLGQGLAPAGDVDGDGVADLAVLAPYSALNGGGALYIIFMKDASTPKNQVPVIWSGNTYPWREKPANVTKALPDYVNSPTSLSSKDLDQDGRPELLIGGKVSLSTTYGATYLLRAFHVGKDGKIERVSELGRSDISGVYYNMMSFGPLASWNNNTSSPTIWALKSGGTSSGIYSLFKYTTYNTQVMRNYSVKAGGDRRKLVGMDSLFHRKGTNSTYEVKTLSGLVGCEFSTDSLSCKAPATAKNTWSTIEVTAVTGSCNEYDLCKEKDTVYIHSFEMDSNELSCRFPIRVLSTEDEPLELGNWYRWAYTSGYPHNDSRALINEVLKSGESPALSFTRSVTGSYSLTPIAKGIDTLLINLDAHPFGVVMHIVLSESIKKDLIPASSDKDTIYKVDSDMYLKLPAASTKGDLYSYDIEQEGLGTVAEVVGDYLLLKEFKDGDSITLSYTENMEVKTRQLVLYSKAPVAIPSVAITGALSMQQVPQGVLIEGLNGDYGVQVFDAQGKHLNSLQGHATGSLLVPLQGTGLRIVRVNNQSKSRFLKIVR